MSKVVSIHYPHSLTTTTMILSQVGCGGCHTMVLGYCRPEGDAEGEGDTGNGEVVRERGGGGSGGGGVLSGLARARRRAQVDVSVN